MIRIELLVFAHLCEELGFKDKVIEFKSLSVSIEDVLKQVMSLSMIRSNQHLRYAVNELFVNSDYILQDGDTLALIPPVSGG